MKTTRTLHLITILLAGLAFCSHARASTSTLHYDAVGNVISQTTPQGTTTYGYDALNRLTDLNNTPSFSYDANGNRLSDGLGSYGYGTGNNQLTTRHGLTVTTDPAGHITSDGVHNFVYNQAGQLSQVWQRGALLASYAYNYRGLRTRKVTTAAAPQGVGTVFYHYDEAGHLIGESDGTGAPLHTYIWHDDTPLAQIDYVPAKRILYFDVDHLNTPRVARDQSGTIVWTWNSDAFGTTQPAASTGVTVNLRFPGQYYDQESGLYYNQNRYYDPAVGRYIESDPIGLAGGINTYAYVEGNPLRYADQDGLAETDPNGPRFGNFSGASYNQISYISGYQSSNPSIFPSAEPLIAIAKIAGAIIIPPVVVGVATACTARIAESAATEAAANAKNLTICALTGLACAGGASKGLDAAMKPADALIRRIEQTRSIRPLRTPRRNTGTIPRY